MSEAGLQLSMRSLGPGCESPYRARSMKNRKAILRGRYVRARRDQLGLTQEGLAERAGLSANYLARLERGEMRNPKHATLEALAAALGVDVATLLSPPEPPEPGSPLERFLASGLAGDVTPEEVEKLQRIAHVLGPAPTAGTYLRILDLIRSSAQSQD